MHICAAVCSFVQSDRILTFPHEEMLYPWLSIEYHLSLQLTHMPRPNKKKMCLFRVTRPYLNLLVKARILSGFLEKYIILCLSKCIKFYFFPEKKIYKKMCAYLNFADPLPETHLLFYLAQFFVPFAGPRLHIFSL